MPSVTVAVSTFREGYFDWVIQLLNSLKNQTFKDFRVLLVVNSNYGYYTKLQKALSNAKDFPYEITIVFNPTDKGIAHARNIALKNATTQYIAFTDDDAIPHAEWLKTANTTFENISEAGALTGPIMANWAAEIQDFASWFPKELYWVIGCTNYEFPSVRTVRNGFASNLIVNREVAVKCGGFNETFGYNQKSPMAGEEPEFSLRLKKLGKLTLWNPELSVYHRITHNRLKLSNILIRSYIQGKTIAHLKKLYGNGAITVETEHAQTVIEAFLKTGSFRSKAYLATSTSAVAVGYFITVVKIRSKQIAGIRDST